MNKTDGRLINLVGEITAGDGSAMERLRELIADRQRSLDKQDIRDVFREKAIPWSQIVNDDVDRILLGDEPRYFLTHAAIVRRYRRNHNINLPRRTATLKHISDSSEVLREILRKEHREHQEYGVTLHQLRSGIACSREQGFFYGTDEWRGRAKIRRTRDGFKCTQCGRSGVELHVHHHEPIYSAYSKKFNHNFDIIRMRTLCKKCHNIFHSQRVRRYFGFMESAEEEKSAEKEYRRKVMSLHDKVHQCPYCCNHIWGSSADADFEFQFLGQ